MSQPFGCHISRRNGATIHDRSYPQASFAFGASTFNAPYRFSYPLSTFTSKPANRFAANGLRTIRSVSWTVTSFCPLCQAWCIPNSNTTSSRVLATLQTFAYELFIFASSHLSLGTLGFTVVPDIWLP